MNRIKIKTTTDTKTNWIEETTKSNILNKFFLRENSATKEDITLLLMILHIYNQKKNNTTQHKLRVALLYLAQSAMATTTATATN